MTPALSPKPGEKSGATIQCHCHPERRRRGPPRRPESKGLRLSFQVFDAQRRKWKPEMRMSVTALFTLMLVSPHCAQASESPGQQEAPFKLDLSVVPHSSEIRPTVLKFVVTLTNTSKEWISEDPCSFGGALYKLSVLYNGIPVQEPEEARSRREAKEEGEARGGICSGHGGRRIRPGEHWEDVLYYDAAKPGTYELTVERKEFSHGPGESTTIRSNTLTMTVPEREKKTLP
jgi:hypothetical protein